MAPPESMINIGGYEEGRREDIPPGSSWYVCLLFCRSPDLGKNTMMLYALWCNNGWTIIEYRDIEQGTEQTSGQRLTAKRKWNLSHQIGSHKGNGIGWHTLMQKNICFCFLNNVLPSFRRGAMQVWSFKTGAIEVLRAAAKETFAGFQAEVELLRGTATESNIRDRNIFEWVFDVTNMLENSTLSLPLFLWSQYFHAKLEEQVFEKNRKSSTRSTFLTSLFGKTASQRRNHHCVKCWPWAGTWIQIYRSLSSSRRLRFSPKKKNSCVVKLQGHLCFYTCSVSCHQLVSRMQNLFTLNFTRLACWPRYWLYISCIYIYIHTVYYIYYIYIYILYLFYLYDIFIWINEGLRTTVANCGHLLPRFFWQFAT